MHDDLAARNPALALAVAPELLERLPPRLAVFGNLAGVLCRMTVGHAEVAARRAPAIATNRTRLAGGRRRGVAIGRHHKQSTGDPRHSGSLVAAGRRRWPLRP